MFILSHDGYWLFNMDHAQRIIVMPTSDSALLAVVYSKNDGDTAVLERYKTAEEAKDALLDLYLALAGGQTYYHLPESTYYHEQKVSKDARTARKGGS